MDLVSAIWEKNRDDLLFYFSEPVRLGKIAHFLQNLSRDKSNNVIDKRQFRALTQLYGLDAIYIKELLDSKEPKIVEEKDDKIVINIISFNDVVDYCYRNWIFIESLGLLKEEHICVREILLNTVTPLSKEILKKKLNKYSCYNKVLSELINLKLINEDDLFIYSPTFFKNINENTCDILSKYNISSHKIIDFYEEIDKIQGYPLDFIEKDLIEAIKEGLFTGILLPIEIKLSNETKTFIFTNPADKSNYDLSYETAAYFRYNQYFAEEERGRLFSPTLFLNTLKAGKAGNASNIGTNYGPLQLKGVIKVVKGLTSGRYSMIPLKNSVIVESKDILEAGNESLPGFTQVSNPPNWLTDPAAYRSTIRSDERKKNLLKLKEIFKDY